MPAPVRAQPEQQKFGFGTHALRRILYETKFKALEDWGDLGNKPNHTLLVVLGGPLSLERIPGGLQTFVDRGGAVLLATDQAIPERTVAYHQLLSVAGTVVTGGGVSALPPANPKDVGWFRATRVEAKAVYRHQPECIIVTPTKEGRPLFVPRTAGQPEEVPLVTNRPSYLLDLPLARKAHRVAE